MPVIELHIRFNPETKQVAVAGPLADRLLCYGMLEMAKEVLQQQATAAKPGPLSPLVMPRLHLEGPLK